MNKPLLEKTLILLRERIEFCNAFLSFQPKAILTSRPEQIDDFKNMLADCETGLDYANALRDCEIAATVREQHIAFLKDVIYGHIQEMIALCHHQAEGLPLPDDDTTLLKIEKTMRELNDCGMEILFLR